MEITELSTKAAAVTAQHEDLAAAIADEREARVAVMQAALLAVRPAVRALSSRIRTSYHHGHHADVNYDQDSTYMYLVERGVYLDTDQAGPIEQNPRANEGDYAGGDVFLLADGRLVWLAYSGGWSRWQGSTSEWSAEIEYTPADVAARELVVHGRDDAAIRALGAALDAQLTGGAPKRAAAARERAEKLRALITLLGGKGDR